MKFDDVIRNRFACRSFSDKEVEKEKIDYILEAGRIAPTAKNRQPIKIVVVSTKEGIQKIDEATSCRYNAPVVLIVCGDKSEAYSNEKISTYEMDSSIVATHMMLAATSVGIDNIWIELFDRDLVKKSFELGDMVEPLCLLPIGYKESTCEPSPLHYQRKNIEDIVIYK